MADIHAHCVGPMFRASAACVASCARAATRHLCTAASPVESTKLYRFKWIRELRVALRLKVHCTVYGPTSRIRLNFLMPHRSCKRVRY